jgi:uncharacterized DUF497 family protein
MYEYFDYDIENHVVRLISARMASAPERERYYNGEGEL